MITSEEKKAYNKIYYESHREHIIQQNKAYRELHRDVSRKSNRKYHYAHGGKPMSEAKNNGIYLGVYVAERALSKYFDNITKMPINNPGYDFICGKGYKIDVKSGCLIYPKTGGGDPAWKIRPNRNVCADYFLVLLFDNLENLNPQHVLLIPGYVINSKYVISISCNPIYFKKWEKYEKPLDRVVKCCTTLRGE